MYANERLVEIVERDSPALGSVQCADERLQFVDLLSSRFQHQLFSSRLLRI